ncbi:hypothetical protein D3C71_1926580 [compost metagenome]
MVSPHPSYPPLEMAAFGMGVVTNRYDNKRLDETMANVVSLDAMTPEAICRALMGQVDLCEARGMHPGVIAGEDDPLLQVGSFDRVADDAAAALGLSI